MRVNCIQAINCVRMFSNCCCVIALIKRLIRTVLMVNLFSWHRNSNTQCHFFAIQVLKQMHISCCAFSYISVYMSTFRIISNANWIYWICRMCSLFVNMIHAVYCIAVHSIKQTNCTLTVVACMSCYRFVSIKVSMSTRFYKSRAICLTNTERKLLL